MNLKQLKIKDSVEDERNMIMFGLFNDGGNAYSNRDDEQWYWTTSDNESIAEFKKRMKRQGERKAQQNYNEYVRGSYGVRVFKDINEFKKAANKVGLNPNLSDYEYLFKEQSKDTNTNTNTNTNELNYRSDAKSTKIGKLLMSVEDSIDVLLDVVKYYTKKSPKFDAIYKQMEEKAYAIDGNANDTDNILLNTIINLLDAQETNFNVMLYAYGKNHDVPEWLNKFNSLFVAYEY